jgi:hypothetical protein
MAQMTVTPIEGEQWTYDVTSAAGDGTEYRVCMMENGGNGACTCVDFFARCQPAYNRSKTITHYPRVNRTQCKHIHAVGEVIFGHLMQLAYKQEKQ